MSPSLTFVMTLLLACGVAACKDERPVEPGKPVVAASTVSTEQAKATLMALPELQTWSTQIEQASNGAHHPALMEDGLQTVNGKKYWQLTFAENGAQALQRRETFLVAERGDEILVRDFETDRNLTLAQWRASRPVVR